MSYESVIEHSGDAAPALEVARQTLVEKGYRVNNLGAEGFEGTHRGMVDTRRAALLGASRITVEPERGRIRLSADLGGVKRTTVFMVLFIPGMAIFMAVLFGFILNTDEGSDMMPWIVLGPFLPWPILIPAITWMLKKRTVTALDTLAHNMATTANGRVAGRDRMEPMMPAGILVMLGVALIVVGGGIGGWAFFDVLTSMTENETLVTVPGTHRVVFDEARAYTVFHQHRTTYNGQSYNVSHNLEGLELRLTGEDTGATARVESIAPSSNYSSGGRAGHSAYRITVDAAGTYELAGTYPAGQEKAESVLSIVPWSMGDLGAMMAVEGLCIGAFVGGILLLSVVRQRSKQARLSVA